ncbi:Ctr copper transporter family-domain-containing protein [Podospora australis]|uniref:Copper transport protein n=1 Tax=Podospora australis TaxID=1536484 RepID=A0AAN6WQV4_9PEZI|nr:Ctr copper transporter family-domain-containing protein [Podospora australis]
MDHSGHSGHGDMGMTATVTSAITSAATAAAAAVSSTPTSGMGGGGHSMGSGNGCKISMLWNWNTIDSCFIASSWKITSSGMFAGSCIGVVLLVMVLELLRRSAKEYDRFLLKKAAVAAASTDDKGGDILGKGYRPNVLEQAIRALLHCAQFAVAYFVMLLAMYYNGYIIICIFIGAYLGSFVFHWEPIGVGACGPTSAGKEPTVCCG